MHRGNGDIKVFSDASSAASFACASLINASNSAVVSVSQSSINLIVSCSYDDVNGDPSFGNGALAVWGAICPVGTIYNGYRCEGFDENKKRPCPDPSSGNPIQTLTGHKIQREPDIVSSSPGGIGFERIFDSRAAFANGTTLGPNWRHSFDAVLKFVYRPIAGISGPVFLPNCSTITDVRNDVHGFSRQGECPASVLQSNPDLELYSVVLERPGAGASYFYEQDGRWLADADGVEMLVPLNIASDSDVIVGGDGNNENTSGANTNPNIYAHHRATTHWQYRHLSGLTEIYHDTGRLLQRTKKGMHFQLQYDLTAEQGGDNNSSTLDLITTPAQESLTLYYHEGLLSKVVDTQGAVYRYFFSNENTTVRPGLLVHVSYPDQSPGQPGENPWGEDNPYRSYHYESDSAPTYLTGITDENRVRYVSWDYDIKRRAILSRRKGQAGQPDEVVQLDFTHLYDPRNPRVIETNPHGKKTIFHFVAIDDSRRVARVEGLLHVNSDAPEIGCEASEQHYSYDTHGRLRTVTDWEGNVTQYQRDGRGREIQRSEGLWWHAGVVGGLLQGYEQALVTSTRWHPDLAQPARRSDSQLVTDWQYDCSTGLLLAERKYPLGSEPVYPAETCPASD
ncbi:MAG: hypothetical protein KJP25_12595 [Gammaproteobacteria bacterium]|nr:hypothetical protein [Gammaproteobacteria bacterium]NNM11129.1 RHS repeat protein [Pseudomonadales bacterium]RZV58858.1 MAG: RHS repeat protein [Pseudomonadales bacterium]